jgi:hypothetical protein
MWALKLDCCFDIVDSLELFLTYCFGNDLFLPSSVKEGRLLSWVPLESSLDHWISRIYILLMLDIISGR